jgi:hypothetical protein
MSKTTTPVLSDTGLNAYHHEDLAGQALVPDKSRDRSSVAKCLTPPSSIDARLKEQLKPAISDRSVMKPDKYQAILEETYVALVNQMGNEKEEASKEALSSLTSLLEEIVSLQTLLNHYMSHMKKA